MKRLLHGFGLSLLLALAAGVLYSNVTAQTATRLWATLSTNLTSGLSTPVTCTASGTGCWLDVSVAGGGATMTSWSTTAVDTATIAGIAATSSDGIILTNSTSATAAVPVQQAPRLNFLGQVWNTGTVATNTDSWIWEAVPVAGATPSGSWRLAYSANGGAYSNVMTQTSAGAMALPAGGVYSMLGRSFWRTSANALFTIEENGATAGIQFNVNTGTVTVASCGSGTVTTGSRNTAGEITTSNTSCIVNFGAPQWTNPPFCTLTAVKNGALTTVPSLQSNPTTASFTINNITAANNPSVMYVCIGRVGTL